MRLQNAAGATNGICFGYAICARCSDDELITLWFADDKETADQAVAKLQHYNVQQPRLGKFGEISSEEAFKRRSNLAKRLLHHPVGETRSYDVVRLETLILPSWVPPVW